VPGYEPDTPADRATGRAARASEDVAASGWVQILDSSEPDPKQAGRHHQGTYNEALVDGHG
jgi:hypothetical protein